MTYAEALAKWQEMEKTKYSDDRIRGNIEKAIGFGDYSASRALSLIVANMIAYNAMIDTRIERAQRSWKNA